VVAPLRVHVETELVDRSSALFSSPAQTPLEVVERIEALRQTARQIRLEMARDDNPIAPATGSFG